MNDSSLTAGPPEDSDHLGADSDDDDASMTGDDDDFYMPFATDLQRQPAAPSAADILESSSQIEIRHDGNSEVDDAVQVYQTSIDISRDHSDSGGILEDSGNIAVSITGPSNGTAVPNAEVSSSSRKRRAAAVIPDTILDDLMICSDDSCRELIQEDDLLTCTAPGCGQNVSLFTF